MTLTLRPYQQKALEAVYNHLRTRDDNPCVVLPTGSGKTPLLARICQDAVEKWHGHIIVLSHVKELIEQAANHLSSFLPPDLVGLHSAGLGRRDVKHPVIVAGIQSAYNKACDMGAFNLVLVDECHLLPERGEGRYLTFLRDARVINPKVRIIGLTATPFRLNSGRLCKPDTMLNHICYEANVKELILDGWLCPLRTRRGLECANIEGVKIASYGDFASDGVQAAFESVIKPACAEVAALCAERRSVLVFAAGIRHASIVAEVLGGEVVEGDTPKDARADIIARFRAGKLKYLVNVNVLTTGFDAPNVDAVVLLRATASAGLYYQMVGRGLRKHPDKRDCLILDYGDNAVRHGPIDQIEVVDRRSRNAAPEDTPGKECPECHRVIAVQYRICANCDFHFPVDYAARHNRRAGDAPVVSEQVKPVASDVLSVRYGEHVKEKEDGPSVTFRVEYVLNRLTGKVVREYLCFNHPDGSFPRRRAEEWWRLRSKAAVPGTVMDALTMARNGALAAPRSITTIQEKGKKFPEIVGMDLPEKPELAGVEDDEDFFSSEPTTELVEANDIPF